METFHLLLEMKRLDDTLLLPYIISRTVCHLSGFIIDNDNENGNNTGDNKYSSPGEKKT